MKHLEEGKRCHSVEINKTIFQPLQNVKNVVILDYIKNPFQLLTLNIASFKLKVEFEKNFQSGWCMFVCNGEVATYCGSVSWFNLLLLLFPIFLLMLKSWWNHNPNAWTICGSKCEQELSHNFRNIEAKKISMSHLFNRIKSKFNRNSIESNDSIVLILLHMECNIAVIFCLM